MPTSLTSPAGLSWLLVSPALRRQFTQRGLAVPFRVPVRWAGYAKDELPLVQLPTALSRALGLSSPFLATPAGQLRPARSVLLWASARRTLRRSLGAIG